MTAIRGIPCSTCPRCGTVGAVLHADVRDRLFGVDGRWDVRRCPACRSTWPDPQPLADDIHLAYSRYYTHGDPADDAPAPAPQPAGRLRRAEDAYLRNLHRVPGPPVAGADRLLAFLIARWAGRREDAAMRLLYLRPQPGARLLDVGCGRGLAVAALREWGWDASGVDPDPAAVAVARATGLPVEQGELQDLAFAERSFDAVTMSHVIEHLPDPTATLQEIHRILRPGGTAVVVTPNADSWLHGRYGRDWLNLDVPRHLRLYSLGALQADVDAAGFDVVEARTTARAANLVAQAARGFRRRGRYDMTARPARLERLWGEAVQQVAAARLRVRPDEGEELVVVARRP